MTNMRIALKMAMLTKGIKSGEVADRLGKSRRTMYNWLSYGSMGMSTLLEVTEVLECDIVLRDRETGQIYG